jgi:hypothetical protein
MRHYITILSPGPTDPPTFDAAGPVSKYNPFCYGWAAMEIVRGIDVIRGGQDTTQLNLTVAMWFQPGILPKMQVQAPSGSRYIIQSVENVNEMGVVLVLNCLALNENL